jgi:hypothetical protein
VPKEGVAMTQAQVLARVRRLTLEHWEEMNITCRYLMARAERSLVADVREEEAVCASS